MGDFFMKLCKNILNLIISVALISFGIGIIMGKLIGFIVYIFAIGAIAIGIYLILR